MKISLLAGVCALCAITTNLQADDKQPAKNQAKKEAKKVVAKEEKPTSIAIDLKDIIEVTAGENGLQDGKIEVRVFGGNEEMPDHIREVIKKLEARHNQLKKAEKDLAIPVTSFGSITIVGPDGKTTTKTFGEKNTKHEDINKEIEAILKGNLKSAEKEHVRIMELMKSLHNQPTGIKIETPENVVLNKLDKIIKRLDKIEKDLAELKEN